MQCVLVGLLLQAQHGDAHLIGVSGIPRTQVQRIAYFAATAHLGRPEAGWRANIEASISTIVAAHVELNGVGYVAHVLDPTAERDLTRNIDDYVGAARALERKPGDDAAFTRLTMLRPVVLARLDTLADLQVESIAHRHGGLIIAVVAGLAAELITLAAIWFGVIVPHERRLRTVMASLTLDRGQIQSFLDHNPDAIAVYSRDGVLVNANHASCELLGRTPAELIGRHLSAFVEPSCFAETAAAFERAKNGKCVVVEVRLRTAVNDSIDVTLSFFPQVVAGETRGVLASARDIRPLKAATADRAELASRLAALCEISLAGGSWKQQLDAALDLAANQLGYEHGIVAQIEGTNAIVLTTTGTPAETEIGIATPLDRSLCGYIVRTDDVWVVDDLLASPVRGDDAVHGTAARSVVAMRLRVGGDRYGSIALTSSHPRTRPLRPADRDFFRTVAALAGSIVTRRGQNSPLGSPTHTDALTGLPNRVAIVDKLDRLTRLAASRPGAEFAVHFIDLDGFREINEHAGHDVGDEVLREVARRFSKCVRGTDIVARLEADKFVVLQPATDGPEGAAGVSQLAERIWRVVEQPFVHKGVRYTLRCSIGVSMFPGDGQDTVTLLKRADEARHRAKSERRDVA